MTEALLELLNGGWRALLETPWVRALLLFAVGFALVRVAATVTFRRVTRPHQALIARKVVAYGGTAVVAVVAAHAAGLDLTALVATAGVATVAVGFASQTSLGNLIAGIFLLIDRPFEVGDTVEIEGRSGVVLEITLLSTFLRTFDNVLVRWPNEVVLKATILNYTRLPARRVDLPITLAYGADIHRARSALVQAAAAQPLVLLEPAPMAVARALVEHGAVVELRVWVAQIDFLEARSAMIAAALAALDEAGVPVAMPRLALWKREDASPPDGPER